MSSFLDSYFEKIKIEGPFSDEAFAREATCFGLLCKKFPNIDGIAITRALKEIPGEPWVDEELRVVITRADVRAIHEYNKELEGMPTQDLFTFYRQESADAGIGIDELTLPPMDEQNGWFYDQPDAQADFEHWSRAEYWTPDEAVAVSFGKSPNVVNANTLKSYLGKASFADEYYLRCDLVDRAIQSGRLPTEMPPADFVAWLQERSIPVPRKLADCLSAIEATSSRSSAKPLSDTERDSLLKLLLAMSIDKYDYKVGETRNPATGENRDSINAALERLDLKLTSDTIRKYLKEAEQRFGDHLKPPRKD